MNAKRNAKCEITAKNDNKPPQTERMPRNETRKKQQKNKTKQQQHQQTAKTITTNPPLPPLFLLQSGKAFAMIIFVLSVFHANSLRAFFRCQRLFAYSLIDFNLIDADRCLLKELAIRFR